MVSSGIQFCSNLNLYLFGSNKCKVIYDAYARFHERICTTEGGLRDSVLLFINDRQVHKENMHQAALTDGARIMVVPSIVGG